MEWYAAFILTLAVEIPALLYILSDLDRKRLLACGLLMNSITHPSLWYLFPLILPAGTHVILGELLVLLIEFTSLKIFFPRKTRSHCCLQPTQ